MIIKSFQLNKVKLEKNNFILLYGKNEGLKTEITNNLLKNKNTYKKYEEREILINAETFVENMISPSLFESEKVIIIKRVTDKLLTIIEEIILKDNENILIIFNSGNLEKKSKLRSLFEKDKKLVCIACYPDTDQILSKLTYNILKKENISISSSNINLVINKCNGDREILLNEIEKIKYFSRSGKKINEENIAKLTNLIENHNVAGLVDNCLAKNSKKIINILNENNFNYEDCILITRTFLNKSKKLLKLLNEYENNRNIDLTISSAKPPIFWKDKEIVKQQIFKWTPEDIRQLIYKINDMELLIKKNINNSIILITDFILKEASPVTNN